MSGIRLDKYLADAGQGTRSQVKAVLRQGRVMVNGEPVKAPEYKVDADSDRVALDGKLISFERFQYYMLHKPAGVISATSDKRERTVIDLIREEKRRDLFPVGRLDKDTEGLLLITNDGKLANHLLTPGRHVAKTYYAQIDGSVTGEMISAFAEGVDIGDARLTAPAELRVVSEGETEHISCVEITITEGRYHQIKRMFESFGRKVVYLKRLSMGPIVLDKDLPCGAYRKLTEQEIIMLKGEKDYGNEL